MLHELNNPNKQTRKKRVGRGIAAGQGKTAGRGTKGQKSRAGHNIPRRFEGGQISYLQRLPKKKGLAHRRQEEIALVAVGRLMRALKGGETVTLAWLKENKLVDKRAAKAKIVLNGTVDKHFTLGDGVAASKSALEMAEKAKQTKPKTPKI